MGVARVVSVCAGRVLNYLSTIAVDRRLAGGRAGDTGHADNLCMPVNGLDICAAKGGIAPRLGPMSLRGPQGFERWLAKGCARGTSSISARLAQLCGSALREALAAATRWPRGVATNVIAGARRPCLWRSMRSAIPNAAPQ